MKRFLLNFAAIIFVAAVVFLVFKIKNNKSSQNTAAVQQAENLAPMKITSPVFLDGQSIPVKYSCDGDGVNPPLDFLEVPKQAQSLALTLIDPDAPNGLWVHWLVWNMATSTTGIAENSVPQAAMQGQGSSGQKVYGSPCPPSGTHRYIFTLYALDEKLNIPSYSTLDDLKKAMDTHVLQQAQLTGLYGKK